MKQFRKFMALTLVCMLTFGGCGSSGGGASGDSPAKSSVFAEPDSNVSANKAKLPGFHDEYIDASQKVSEAILKDGGIVDLAYQLQNTDFLTQGAIAKSLLEAFDVAAIDFVTKANALSVNAINFDTINNAAQSKKTTKSDSAEIRKPRIIGIGLVITVGLIGYAAKNYFDNGAKVISDRNTALVEKIASTDEKGKKKVVELLNKNGASIDEKASIDDIKNKFKSLTVNNGQTMAKEIQGYAFENPMDYDEPLTSYKNDTVKVAKKLGEIAVEGTVTGVTSVSGSVGSLIPNEKIGAVVDVVTTVASVDPIGLVNRHVSATTVSQKKETSPVDATDKTLSYAKPIMEKVEKEGVGNITIQELEDSSKAILKYAAQNDGDGDDLVLSSPIYSSTQAIDFAEKSQTPDEIKVNGNKYESVTKIAEKYDWEPMDVIYTNANDIVETVEGVVAAISDGILIKIESQKPSAGLSVSSEVSVQDETSITYLVTAQLTGIKAPTTVTLTLENAAASGTTKTLTSDGTVSWSVTVLDKNGVATVQRSDNGAQGSVTLPAKVMNFDGMYTGSFTTTYESETGFCFDSGDVSVIVSGSTMSGDATGTVVGNKVSGTGEYGMVFSGTISGTIMQGSWHDPEGDCSGTFFMTKQ